MTHQSIINPLKVEELHPSQLSSWHLESFGWFSQPVLEACDAWKLLTSQDVTVYVQTCGTTACFALCLDLFLGIPFIVIHSGDIVGIVGASHLFFGGWTKLNYDLRLFQGLKPPTSYIFIFFGGLEMQKSTFFFPHLWAKNKPRKTGDSPRSKLGIFQVFVGFLGCPVWKMMKFMCFDWSPETTCCFFKYSHRLKAIVSTILNLDAPVLSL
jgi:hypothetical protein